MWQDKQDNIILPGQIPCTSRSRQGPHGENTILPPPSGNHDGSSRKRKSTAIDSPRPTSEYHFPWDSSPRDASSQLGLSGQGNNTIVYPNQANSAEPVNLRPQFDQNNCGVYSNQANFRHQFDNGHHHYSYNSSETWPTRNTNFNGTGIATMTNASYNLPPQHRGFRPLVEMPVGQPFTVPNQQSQAGYVFGQTEPHINLPFSSNSGTEKAQVGPNLHDLVNFSNKNSTMYNTWVDFARPVEIFQQNFVQPNRSCEGLNGIMGPKEDKKSETSCAPTQSGQCLSNAGIVNLPSVGTISLGASICTEQDETNRLLTEEQNHSLGDIKIKETTVLASDMENQATSLTENISSINGVSDDNITAEGQRNDKSDGLLKLDERSKSPCGKTASTVAAEKLWDGSLQLNSSVTVSAVAFFKSGEKLLDTNWSEFVEVKGKVRLEAFEKYIQDLPRSRNRGLMVISLYWKEGSSDSGLSGMKEVSKAYRKGQRVGFAHLSPGVDIYICPRSDTIITILAKYGFFKGMAAIEDNRDSMIGCVVWRKNRTSSNSDSKKGETKNTVSSNQIQTLDNKVAKGTEKKNKESSEAQKEVAKSSVDAINLPTEEYSPIRESLGQCLEIQKLNSSLESQNPVVNVVEQTTPNSDDDDLPEYDFGFIRGVSGVSKNKPLEASVPPMKPLVQAMPASGHRPDTSSVPSNCSAPNQGMPVSRNLEEHNLERKKNQTNTFESPKNSYDELRKKKNRFDDDDDDDDIPEWCPPEIRKQPLAESIRPTTSLPSVGPTFQNMSPGPPRAPLPLPSQAPPIRPSIALPSPLLNPSLQNMSPRPLLPSPPSAATRAPFSYQTFRPTFSGPIITSVNSPLSVPLQSGPRSSMGFNPNSLPRPQYGDRRGRRP